MCGERVEAFAAVSTGDQRCGLCRRVEPQFASAKAYGSYSGGLRQLIHLLKYDGVRPAASTLGRMLAETFSGFELSESILVVPVPLHASKLRQRGFNQSELIAREALKILKQERLELRTNVLRRVRVTESQLGLSRHQRRQNIRGAFSVTHPEELAGARIVLVDDVMTTGATANECARVLRRAGASKILVATVARTLKDYAEPLATLEPEESLVTAAS